MDITGTQEEGYEKKEKYKNYVILGIGEGLGSIYHLPISRFGSVEDKIKRGALYLSVDNGLSLSVGEDFLNLGYICMHDPQRYAFQKCKEMMNNFKRNNPQLSKEFVFGDMVQLPLADNSVNEIWLENVLSSIGKGQEIIIKELLRVLKRRGKVYVIEYYTPKKIKKYLEEYGFLKDGAEIKIYSGENMFDAMFFLGLSDVNYQKLTLSILNMQGRGVTSISDVFLAEITKNN
jgi:hypothetical protein